MRKRSHRKTWRNGRTVTAERGGKFVVAISRNRTRTTSPEAYSNSARKMRRDMNEKKLKPSGGKLRKKRRDPCMSVVGVKVNHPTTESMTFQTYTRVTLEGA